MQQVVSTNIAKYLLYIKCSYFSARTICTDGDVRLEEKESEYVGRVGLCY